MTMNELQTKLCARGRAGLKVRTVDCRSRSSMETWGSCRSPTRHVPESTIGGHEQCILHVDPRLL